MNVKKRLKRQWQDVVTFFLGVWLVISPFLLPMPEENVALFNNTLIVGTLVQWTAIINIVRPNAWKEWLTVILAAWSMSSAYFFDDGMLVDGLDVPLGANLFIVGGLLMVDAIFGLYRRKAIHDMDKPLPGQAPHK